MERPRILIIDDEHSFRQFLGDALTSEGYAVHHAATARAGLALARRCAPHVVLLDQKLPDGNGMDILPELQRQGDPIVVMITAFADYPKAVEAVKAGAFHYLSKPFEFDSLLKILADARISPEPLVKDEPAPLSAIVGEAPGIVALKRSLVRIAQSPVMTVLVRGESGTGKELVAKAIHALSPRAKERMLSVNCAALTETLLMSEIFGHQRGAFTDACEQKKGLFETANEGTLFLDEISEMGLQAQAALLRVLEQRVVTRVGGTEEIAVNVRVVAASNRNLVDRVAEGLFRADLYFRLNVVDVLIPPLRERGTDVLLLANQFARTLSHLYKEPIRTFSRGAEEALMSYSWPGNVRELRNAIERTYVVGAGPLIAASDLAFPQAQERGTGGRHPALTSPGSFRDAKNSVVQDFERAYLREMLEQAGGNVTRAAEQAGMLRQSFQRLLHRYQLTRDSDYDGAREGAGGPRAMGR
jgi:two-component system response regulator HydG